ncbi:PP_RS20740 family protein [Pseudoalteromonas sp. SWYJZ19]|uniref:PP_RS20740 family protein n=1 Tax=Pseudoalteromonas sp. SWYJZ19 TaxID=2792068 RepID=UPI0018CF5EB8|nr:hypothetical protein [Pseudoalteromonas sp. SWYJZ19]MBH0051672.1 hypothetical protein [Pseudoalteromonas sp. SWYJZ19]
MADIFSSDDDLFDLAEVTGKVDDVNENSFKPWHKPRKQFIRENQWFNPLKRIAKSTKYNTINTLNYFGLPGGDLLDVTYISQKLLAHNELSNKNFLIHGFINDESEFKKAQSGLSKLLDRENVCKNSKIENFDFEALSTENSEAWKRVNNVGHYHFINLDFCNCILNVRTLPAIYRLLDYQTKRVIGAPWMLCITTRLNKTGVTPSLLEKFDTVLQEIKSNGDIVEAIDNAFSRSLLAVEKLTELEDAQKELLNELLQVCLIFWLVNEAIKKGCTIELKSSYKYSVDLHDREHDMHSFVFALEKKDRVEADTLGLVSQSSEEVLTEEKIAQLKNKAFEKLGRSLDLDAHLERDSELLNQFADNMMDLLGKCGYDVSTYKQVMTEQFGYEF